ncbi:unnamed protein product [Pseudo-nitzschia multistriata]|uniref:C3H1-type domain-containing protein n=1 Tax=Pseudo-nitzschia multistriata TaxID=183589 RepID=A0A448Z3Y7_9STRA|nr:unnamed protein product [Pseudo-nitzschia multistriata]
MFRKPKRSAKKAGLRARKKTTTSDDEEDKETTQEVQEALKRAKNEHNGGNGGGKFRKSSGTVDDDDDGVQDGAKGSSNSNNSKPNTVMHRFEADTKTGNQQKDLATATAQHHPKAMESISKSASQKDPKRNKFLAGPIRAPTNIRTTCRFDYQPDICKDYKDTGFCGFGDTCIYLHDRGDTMSGWQLEQAWEEKQKTKKREQEEQMERFMNKVDAMDNNNKSEGNESGSSNPIGTATDDGIPFACFLSRKAFEDPIVTICGHYFSQGCLQDHFQQQQTGGEGGQRCPICGRDTHGVMNQPTKLIAKKRKLLGRKATWQQFMDARGGAAAGMTKGNDDFGAGD